MQSPTATAVRQIDDLDGPPGLPLLGNTFQVTRGRMHQDLERWAVTYGPVFRIKLGAFKILVVTDSAIATSVLRERPDTFRRPHRSRDILEEMGFHTGVFSAEGDAWRAQRRMVMASFSPAHVRAYFPALSKVTQRLHRRWLAAARSGAALDLQPELMRFTVDAIAGLAFGAEVNTLESDEDIIQHHLDKIFPALFQRIFSPLPLWRWFPTQADRALKHSVREVNAAIQGFIAQARQCLQDRPSLRAQPDNLLEAMLVAADAPDSGVGDADVAGNVLTMLLAGEDTTANTLSWLLWLLSSNPQALQRAQQEVLGLGVDDPSAFTPELLATLDYLEACIQEAMRLKPVAPWIPVEAVVDTVVAGVAVPAGGMVWPLLRHDTMQDANFPDARSFLPERWLGNAAAIPAAESMSAAKRMAMPFGSGPRVCPGRYLALLEMKLAMAMLLSQFDILSVDTEQGDEPAELMSFTMSPVGLRMRLRERL